jgi:hypothetical protein
VPTEEPAIFVPKNKPWAWVVVAKCASNSIRYCVHKKLGLPQTTQARHRIQRLASRAELTRVRRFRFAFVRDPWRRLLSCYVDQIVGKNRNKLLWYALHASGLGFASSMSFDRFVRLIAELPDNRSNAHTASQFNLLSYNGKLIVDFAGHMDRIKEDWAKLQKQFGFCDLPHRHSTGANPSEYYTDELTELVAKRYACDIEAFGPKEPDW